MQRMITITMGLKNHEKLCIIHGATKSWVGDGNHAQDVQHSNGLKIT